MVIRHCTPESNVDANHRIISPTEICHVVVEHGRIADISGPIDPLTHLNLDYPDHRADLCVMAERLEVGAPVRFNDAGPEWAYVRRDAYEHLGPVDYTARLLDMIGAVKKTAPDPEGSPE